MLSILDIIEDTTVDGPGFPSLVAWLLFVLW